MIRVTLIYIYKIFIVTIIGGISSVNKDLIEFVYDVPNTYVWEALGNALILTKFVTRSHDCTTKISNNNELRF